MPFYIKNKEGRLRIIDASINIAHKAGGKKEVLVSLTPVGDDLVELRITPAKKDSVTIRWGVGFREVSKTQVIVAESDIILHDLGGAGNRIIVVYSAEEIVFSNEDDLAFDATKE